jgi:hypothetical protein
MDTGAEARPQGRLRPADYERKPDRHRLKTQGRYSMRRGMFMETAA